MTSVRHPDRLVLALKLVADLPPLSPMVRHLLATLYSPTDDISLSQVAVWIEKDTLTAGRILALADSAYYARAEPIVSIHHAVYRLGLNANRNLVASMSRANPHHSQEFAPPVGRIHFCRPPPTISSFYLTPSGGPYIFHNHLTTSGGFGD